MATTGLTGLRPKLVLTAVAMPVFARYFVQLSMLAAPEEARTVYEEFWSELKLEGWGLRGRIQVAIGLGAVRRRNVNPAKSIKRYSESMGAIIPRPSLGWCDAPTA